ncbi:hypothetical protein NMY22_g19325 [Coprinellus aureogranulatus]|nr:hypothetical protein NMY22_g19325 [Coprinellus aureogranulatus]
MSAHPSDPTANIIIETTLKLECVPSIKRAFPVEYRLSSTKPLRIAQPFPTWGTTISWTYRDPAIRHRRLWRSAGANLAHYMPSRATSSRLPLQSYYAS